MRKPALDLSDVVRQAFQSWNIVRACWWHGRRDLLGRAELSSPNAAQRRAEGAGLDSEGADRAIMNVAACGPLRTLSERLSTSFYRWVEGDARATLIETISAV